MQAVATTSSSLLTSSKFEDITYLACVQGLSNVTNILGETSAEEYSITGRAATKITLLISCLGTLPDFRTIQDVLHECIDNCPDQYEMHRPSFKTLADAICTYLHLFFTGQPRDLSQIANALCDVISHYCNLCGLDRSAVYSVINGLRFLFSGQHDDNDDGCGDGGLNSANETLLNWVEKTDHISDSERPYFRSAIDAVFIRPKVSSRAHQLDLIPVSTLIYQGIDRNSEIHQSQKLQYKVFINATCKAIESLVNKPANLKPLCDEIHRFIDSQETISDFHSFLVKAVVDTVSTLIECLCNKPLNLDPVRDMLHEYIDIFPDFSKKDRSYYKSFASETCAKLQSRINRGFTLLSMYTVQPSSKDTSQSTYASQFSQKWGPDPSLRELGLLMHKLRKLGIRVYMHYNKLEPL